MTTIAKPERAVTFKDDNDGADTIGSMSTGYYSGYSGYYSTSSRKGFFNSLVDGVEYSIRDMKDFVQGRRGSYLADDLSYEGGSTIDDARDDLILITRDDDNTVDTRKDRDDSSHLFRDDDSFTVDTNAFTVNSYSRHSGIDDDAIAILSCGDTVCTIAAPKEGTSCGDGEYGCTIGDTHPDEPALAPIQTDENVAVPKESMPDRLVMWREFIPSCGDGEYGCTKEDTHSDEPALATIRKDENAAVSKERLMQCGEVIPSCGDGDYENADDVDLNKYEAKQGKSIEDRTTNNTAASAGDILKKPKFTQRIKGIRMGRKLQNTSGRKLADSRGSDDTPITRNASRDSAESDIKSDGDYIGRQVSK